MNLNDMFYNTFVTVYPCGIFKLYSYSPFRHFRWVSPVSIKNWKVQIFGTAFVSFPGSPTGYMNIVTADESTTITHLIHATGFRHFPVSTHNRSSKLAFGKPSLYLVSDSHCGSVVPDCL